jgi:hypothetical protein
MTSQADKTSSQPETIFSQSARIPGSTENAAESAEGLDPLSLAGLVSSKSMRLAIISMYLASVALCVVGCGPDRGRGRGPSGDGGSHNGDSGMCGPPCSSDLHSVLDCNGNVVTTCPTDEGCNSSGSCEPACQAAIDNHSAVGCEYYAVNPPVYTQSCFAAYVANTWGEPVTIGVDQAGTTLDVTKFAYVPSGSGAAITYAPLSTGTLQPGSIAILFLSDASTTGDCPTGLKVATTGAGFTGTATGQAFHITTSEPVIAYDIFPYGGGSSAVTSATLLLPVSVWDVNYVGITAYPQTITEGGDSNPWLSFVAAQDGTQVTIQPTVAIAGGTGVAAGAAGSATVYAMSAGEVLRLSQPADLSGSPIVSNKPIGVWAGNGCANLPAGMVACDGMHQQIPPVKALGHEYAAVRYRNRIAGMEESPPWRIMGVVDGTTITYDPAAPAGAPTTLMKGQVVEFDAAGPFDVQSQDALHPFYFGAHMTGCGVIGGYGSPLGCAGDPEFVNVIPQEQYLDDYVFFTDPTYPETDLVFVRAKGGSGFADVTLDCAGTLSGWAPVDSGDNYEYTRVDLVTGNFAKVGACDNGRHEAKSTAPFTLTVWGWGTNQSTLSSQAVSYAYPAGAGVKSINTVTVPIQ